VALLSDTTSSLTINGRSALQTTGTVPVFSSNDGSRLNVNLVSGSSGVSGTAGIAVNLAGLSTGTFSIANEFLISGTAGGVVSGSNGNITNTTTGTPPVVVTLPP
jgi:hypothetical protein